MEEIIDRIYEASVIPDLWVDVIDRIAPIADCDGGFLISVDSKDKVRSITSKYYAPLLQAFSKDGWVSRNIRAARLAKMNYPGFVVDYDVVTPAEVETDPFYQLLRSYGAGWGTGTIIPVPTGDLIVLDIERSGEKGPLDRNILSKLDQLRPHLARSALISVRLGLERARAMTETLGKLDLPGAVLRSNGSVISTNHLLENMREQFFSIAGERLAVANESANKLFQAAIANFARSGPGFQCQSIPIPAVDDALACVAHLLPARRQARDIFGSASILLVVTALAKPKAPPTHVLHGLFDLTPAEARVTSRLVEGSRIEEIAKASGLSRETIRTQIKSVLAKTGTTRQAELLGLLSGATIGHGP